LVERNGGDGEFVGGELGEGSAEILDPKQAGKRFGGPKNEQDDPTAAGVDIEATALDRRKFERKGFVQKLEALEVVGDAAVQGGLAGEAAGFVEKFAFQRRVVVADGGDLDEQSGGAAIAGVAVLEISGGGNDVTAAFVFLTLQALHQQRNAAESRLGTDFARGGWFLLEGLKQPHGLIDLGLAAVHFADGGEERGEAHAGFVASWIGGILFQKLGNQFLLLLEVAFCEGSGFLEVFRLRPRPRVQGPDRIPILIRRGDGESGGGKKKEKKQPHSLASIVV
jgi:hypothetical protein